MKTLKIMAAAVALSAGLGNIAVAHEAPFGHRDGRSGAEQRDGQRATVRAQERRAGHRADRRDDRLGWRHDARVAQRHHDARPGGHWSPRDPRWNGHGLRGAGPRHDLHRGGHLPPRYRGHVHVVEDWRGHHLHRPPPGHRWVRAGGDYVLAAIATGVILSIVLGH